MYLHSFARKNMGGPVSNYSDRVDQRLCKRERNVDLAKDKHRPLRDTH